MSVKHSLLSGIAQVRRAWKMIILLWLANLGIALILAFPMYGALDDSLRGTEADSRVLKGFDFDWFSGFRASNSGWLASLDLTVAGPGGLLRNYERLLDFQLGSLGGPILGLGILYWFMQAFMAGGILHILNTRDGRFSLIEFFSGSGLYFLRFFRLALLSWMVLAGLYWLFRLPLAGLWNLTFGESASERILLYSGLLKYLGIGILFGLVGVLFDYAKIRTVHDSRRSMFIAFLSAVYFVISRAGRAGPLYVTLLFMGLLLGIGFGILERGMPAVSILTVLIAFLLQQLFMVSKMWMKLLFYSSQLALYRADRAEQA